MASKSRPLKQGNVQEEGLCSPQVPALQVCGVIFGRSGRAHPKPTACARERYFLKPWSAEIRRWDKRPLLTPLRCVTRAACPWLHPHQAAAGAPQHGSEAKPWCEAGQAVGPRGASSPSWVQGGCGALHSGSRAQRSPGPRSRCCAVHRSCPAPLTRFSEESDPVPDFLGCSKHRSYQGDCFLCDCLCSAMRSGYLGDFLLCQEI